MPELKGLRCRALSVELADHNQCWRLHTFYESNGGAAGIHRWIIVNRRTEVRNHPFINLVLSVVALPVRNSSAGNCGGETVGLCNGPHGHEPSVAPSGNTQPIGVDGMLWNHGIDATQNVF